MHLSWRRFLLFFLVLAVLAAGGFLSVVGCRKSALDVPEPEPEAGPCLFEVVTAASGINMTFHNGEEAGHRAILESLGGGIALIDYDNDGLLDVFIPGGGRFKGKEILGLPCKLYRNLGNWKFKDVTSEVGLERQDPFYSHGAAVADFDNDGWPDLLISGWGGVTLYHNEPDGKGGRRFVDVTRKAGIADNWHWASSAAWADLDGDGYPELYVCQYADWSFANHPTNCVGVGNQLDVCPPLMFKPIQHRLFRNNRDGTFTDVTHNCCIKDGKRVGLRQDAKGGTPDVGGRGLAVLMIDVNGDGKPDIYVANDETDKFLYMNRSKGGQVILEEVGLKVCAAGDDRGKANGSMGLAAADYNHSGRPSLFVTNYEQELHALYRNDCKDGVEIFFYATHAAGIGVLGNAYVGWGTGFLDFDLDGWDDLFIAHGHVIQFPQSRSPRRQLPFLMHNTGGKFVVTPGARGGSYFLTPHNARGVAFGDLNNRGRTDLVISNLNEPVDVLKNVVQTSNHWLGVELAGRNNRDVVGARIVVEVEGATLTHFAKAGGSYASSSDKRHLIGLGAAREVRRVTVAWPWGTKEFWEGLQPDRYWKLTEGDARATEVHPPQGKGK